MLIKPVRFKAIHSDVPMILPENKQVSGVLSIGGGLGYAGADKGLPVRIEWKYRFYIDNVHTYGFIAEDLNTFFFEKGESPINDILAFIEKSKSTFFDEFHKQTFLIAVLVDEDKLGDCNVFIRKAEEIFESAKRQFLL